MCVVFHDNVAHQHNAFQLLNYTTYCEVHMSNRYTDLALKVPERDEKFHIIFVLHQKNCVLLCIDIVKYVVIFKCDHQPHCEGHRSDFLFSQTHHLILSQM